MHHPEWVNPRWQDHRPCRGGPVRPGVVPGFRLLTNPVAAPAALDLAAVAASRAAATGRPGASQPTTANVPRGRSARGATRE